MGLKPEDPLDSHDLGAYDPVVNPPPPDPFASAKPGGPAYQTYLNLLNRDRKGALTMTAVNPKTIDQKTKTRFAVVQVLTTGNYLTGHEVLHLLAAMRYDTTASRIRDACRRLGRRGIVAKIRAVLSGHHTNYYKLTSPAGADFALEACGLGPKKNPPSTTRRAKGSGGTQKSSKGSSGRTSSMCNIDPNRPTFNQAVKDVVEDMVTDKRTFSAYDVTRTLRELANKGTLAIDPQETGTVHVGGKGVPRIDHDHVKGVVIELFQTGAMSGYDRAFNGNWMEYSIQPVAAAPLPSVPAAPAAPAAADPSQPPPTPASGAGYTGAPTL